MKRAIMAAGPQPRAYSQPGTVLLASSDLFASSHGVPGLQALGRTPSFTAARHFGAQAPCSSDAWLSCMTGDMTGTQRQT